MYKNHTLLFVSMMLFGLSSIGNVKAHVNVVPKSNADRFDGRVYQEGTVAYFDLSIPHGCKSASPSGATQPTTHVAVLFPNQQDLSAVAYTQDKEGTEYAGNAMMSIKPATDSQWRKIRRLREAVSPYYDHGVKSDDIRAIQWRGGYVPTDSYATLSFRAKLPLLKSCVSQLKVYLPAVQYCMNNTYKAWIREPTQMFSADTISSNYAPYILVQRDLEQNPLPADCRETVQSNAYPSAHDIDRYLRLPRWVASPNEE